MANSHHRHDPDGCPSCDLGPFARNNFFTGKLLLERDFSDEQAYFVDKLRHHNRRLHGWGVVCGLRVKQHPTPGCRDRFVCIEPGTALDCCGHEIVLREEECVDLTLLPAVQALDTAPSANGPDAGEATHTLQICLRYRECGTEPIPVLYDECGCDDTRCLPNRILESFEVDVKVDPPASTDTWDGPRLERGLDIGFAQATRVVFNAVDGLVYVLAGTTVHAVDRSSRAILRSHDLASTVHGLDLSPSGTHLYAVREREGGGLTLTVLQASDFAVTHEDEVPNGQTPVATAVSAAADGRFLVLVTGAPSLLVYGSDLEGAAPAAPTSIDVPADRTLLAIAPDGTIAYVAGTAAGSATDPAPLEAVDIAAETLDPSLGALLPGVRPNALSTATVGTKALLLVAGADGELFAIEPGGPDVLGPVTLAGAATKLAGQPWVYALQTAGGMSRLQVVGVPRMLGNVPDPVGPAIGFSGEAHDLAVAPDAIYVAYTLSDAEPGGIAVFTVESHECQDLLWESLDGCEDCDEPGCIVLATIHGYRPGFAMLDPADGSTAPEDDLAAHVARIDNRAGRMLLPSTSVLTDLIRCILDQGTGGGAQGPPGEGRDGPMGPAGPGLEAGLVRITALSWEHDRPILVDQLRNITGFPDPPDTRHGVIIAFTGEVSLDGVDPVHVFQVDAPLLARQDQGARSLGYACRCPVRGSVVAVDPAITGNLVTSATVLPGAGQARAIAFVFDPEFVSTLREFQLSDLWVRLRGDFVLDTRDPPRAIDAEFVRHEFDTGDRPAGSDVGVQGGIFESWFEPRRD